MSDLTNADLTRLREIVDESWDLRASQGATLLDHIAALTARAETAEATVQRVEAHVSAMGDPADPKHLHPQTAGLLLQLRSALAAPAQTEGDDRG